MIDIVTVVFREELPILRVQAESVDLYCQNIGLQTIYVVVNDDISIVKEIDPAWWGSLSKYVKIIHRDYFNCKFVEDGWVSQQVLKLLCSTLSQNEYTMILDAKTILIKSLELNYLFDKDKKITFGYFPIIEVFYPSRDIVNELFNINLINSAGPGGVPHIFNTKLIYNMINDITKLTGENFAEWFQMQGMLTEFILYSGYVLYCDGTLDLTYSNNTHYQVCNICHSEVVQFDTKLVEMNHSNVLTVSIHRNCWSQLTNGQQLKYVMLLESQGITRAKSLL